MIRASERTHIGLPVALVRVLTIALLGLLATPVQALAKSYSVDVVSIHAEVLQNGDMRVRENRRMTFKGDYSQVYWVLGTGGSNGIEFESVGDTEGSYAPTDNRGAIDDRSQRVARTYLLQEDGGALTVRAFHDARDSTRSFVLSYLVKGAAKRWNDVGELYWQFVGDGWDVPTRKLAVTIDPPSALTQGQVKAWAHGPLAGVVEIRDDGAVTLSCDDVPARTLIEARVTYPPSALGAAESITQPRLETIIDEEGLSAEQANALRREARGAEGASQDTATNAKDPLSMQIVFLLGGSTLAVVIVGVLTKRVRKEGGTGMAWFAESGQPLDPTPAKRLAALGAGDEPWAAVETKYNYNDAWNSGWLVFTNRRIFWFQTKMGLLPHKAMEEYSYFDSLSLGDRPLSSKKWFCLAGVSFMMSKDDSDALYRMVNDVRARQQEYEESTTAPAAGPVSLADELTKLAQLRDSGILSAEEFDAQKAKLLGA